MLLPFLAAACACAAPGCRSDVLSSAVLAPRNWAAADIADEVAPASSATVRPAPRTIPVELVFIRCDAHDSGWQDDLWRVADEQLIDADLRRRLAANGLRVGVVSGPLPAAVAERMQPAASAGEEALPGPPSDRPAVVRRLLKLLPGRDSEIVAAAGLEELVLLEHDGDAVHGGTYRDATAHFDLRSWPAADGRVRLELTPAVKHGPLERSWVGEQGVFRMEAGQREQRLDLLTFSVTIPPDATLFVGCAGAASSTVGDAFFRERSPGPATVRLLALRPQSRVVDPLFAGGDAAPATAEP